MNNSSFRQLLKEQFPPTVVIIHSLLLMILSIIIIPLLLFSDKLIGKEFPFILVLVLYFAFVASITALVIYKLYKWDSKKKDLLQEFQSSDAELIENKKVHIKLEVSFTELTKYAFGKDPFKMTEVGFESCDIIKIEDSIVIFGKGYNSVIPKGKLVSEPFEINYKNIFRTDLNMTYLLNQEVQNENTCFELKVLGPWGEYTFEMIIYDYVL